MYFSSRALVAFLSLFCVSFGLAHVKKQSQPPVSLTEQAVQDKINETMPVFMELSSGEQEVLLNALFLATQVAHIENEIVTVTGYAMDALYGSQEGADSELQSQVGSTQKLAALSAYLEKLKIQQYILRRQFEAVLAYMQQRSFKNVLSIFESIQSVISDMVQSEMSRSDYLVNARIKELSETFKSLGHSLAGHASLLQTVATSEYEEKIEKNGKSVVAINRNECVDKSIAAIFKVIAKDLLPRIAAVRKQQSFIGQMLSVVCGMYCQALAASSELVKAGKQIGMLFDQDGFFIEDASKRTVLTFSKMNN